MQNYYSTDLMGLFGLNIIYSIWKREKKTGFGASGEPPGNLGNGVQIIPQEKLKWSKIGVAIGIWVFRVLDGIDLWKSPYPQRGRV